MLPYKPVAAGGMNVWLGVPTQAQDSGEYLLADLAELADIAPLLNCLMAHGDDDGGGVGVNFLLQRTPCAPLLGAASLEGFNDYGVDECWFFDGHD